MRSIFRGALGIVFMAFAFGCASGPAHAVNTQNVGVCDPANPTRCLQPQADGSINVNGSFSATLAGFTPNGTNGTPVSVTTSSSRQQLPATSAVVLIGNKGSNAAYVRLGDSSVTATVNDIMVPAGGGCALAVGTNTYVAAITASSTTTLNTAGGTGLGATCFGGGGGGSGPSSTVAIDQTTPGTTNGVQTLSGSTTAATQSGPWNVTNVSGTVSLPTGAATAAKQPALGTAGSPSADVITVQGNASGTAIPVSSSTLATAANQATGNSSLSTIATNSGTQATAANQTSVIGTKNAGTAATNSLQVGGVYNSTPLTLSNGQQSSLQFDANGYAKVNIAAGGGSGGTSYAQGSTTSGQNVSPAGCATVSSSPTNTNAQTNMVTCDISGNLNVNVKSATGVAQGSTTSGQSISPIACRTLSSAPTDTTGQTNMPRCDTGGNFTVNCVSGCSSSSNNYGSVMPTAGQAIGFSDGTNMQPGKVDSSGGLRVSGNAASGSSVAGNPLLDGCRAATAAPTAVTDGQAVPRLCGVEGKGIVLPYAIKELMLRGANSATGTSATTFTGMGAQGASIKIYVTGVQCFRTDAGTTTSYVTLNDGATTTIPLPVGGGSNATYEVPLAVAANTAFQFTPHDALTTVFCNAQGYAGP